MKHHHHPGVRILIALTILGFAAPGVGSVLWAVALMFCHHVALIAALYLVRLVAGMVPGLHTLLSALVGYRLTRLLIGEHR